MSKRVIVLMLLAVCSVGTGVWRAGVSMLEGKRRATGQRVTMPHKGAVPAEDALEMKLTCGDNMPDSGAGLSNSVGEGDADSQEDDLVHAVRGPTPPKQVPGSAVANKAPNGANSFRKRGSEQDVGHGVDQTGAKRDERRKRAAAGTELKARRIPRAATGGPLFVSARSAAALGMVQSGAAVQRQGNGNGVVAAAGGVAAGASASANGASGETRQSAGLSASSEQAVMAVAMSELETGGQGETAGAPVATPTKAVVTPLDVVQVERQWQDDVWRVSFAVVPDEDASTLTPNGLLVCQQIPDGWEIVEAEPKIQAVDHANHVAKWLFVGDALTDWSTCSLALRATGNSDSDVENLRAWYTYRQPNGECVEVAVIPFDEIQ